MNHSDPSSRAAAQTTETSDPTRLAAEPLVSVYMLAYRHERFIAEAIEGVVSQQCDFPFELIIGEDCSPDRTRQIVFDYQRRYPHLIRILTSERNVGAYANGRRCQLATRGRFVAICEGDDYWHNPNKLQMQVDMMSADPEIMVSHTDFDRLTRFRRWQSKHKNHPTPWLAKGDAYEALLHEWSVMTATTMFRKELLTAFIGSKFDEPSWPFGDYNKLLFASVNGRIGYIAASTATYRKARGSAGNQDNSAHLRMKLAGHDCAERFLEDYPVEPDVAREVRARMKRDIYKAAFYAGRLDIMQSSYDWLQTSGLEHHIIQHNARAAAIKLKVPLRLLRAVKNFIDLHLSSIPS